ncbi:MAG: HD domain-containing protein [Flavobacteriales bacterium]|nr:HD domain-containing protein [Flavobacteriales bacterium]
MQLKKAIDHIVNLLRENLSENLTYHSVDHTVGVIDRALEIARAEGLPESELTILLLGAAYHDSGFLETYENHEEKSCDLASRFLPEFGFDETQIERVSELIMETKIPHNPKSKLAEILCDADMAYIGGKRYQKISQTLFEELRHYLKDIDSDVWIEKQIVFLENQQFWTEYARGKYQSNKNLVLKRLKQKLMQAG